MEQNPQSVHESDRSGAGEDLKMHPRGYDGVAVAVPVTVGYFRSTRHDVRWLLGRALAELVRAARIRKSDVDGLTIGSYRLYPDNSASLSHYLGLGPRTLFDLPYGGASGVIALRRAARAIQAGDADIVACIAADTPQSGFGIGEHFSNVWRDHVYPHGAGGPNSVFALITGEYLRRYGATMEDFGRICIAQRSNGMKYPASLFKKELTMAEYLSARRIADPIGLYDCVTRCAGAEAFLVLSEDRARFLKLPYARLAGAIEQHNGFPEEPVQLSIGYEGQRDSLYAQAGMGPDDMDFVQVYDDYPVISMLQLESLGFCAKGEGPKLVRERDLTVAGDLPFNTSGGMLSLGQAGAGAGILGLNEALRQLTKQTRGAVVNNAEKGVISCYGTVNYDRGLCSSAAILTRGQTA